MNNPFSEDHVRSRMKLFCAKATVITYASFEVGHLKKENDGEISSLADFGLRI